MAANNETDLEYQRDEKMSIARQLCYGPEVIHKLRKAKSLSELEHIMADARHSC